VSVVTEVRGILPAVVICCHSRRMENLARPVFARLCPVIKQTLAWSGNALRSVSFKAVAYGQWKVAASPSTHSLTQASLTEDSPASGCACDVDSRGVALLFSRRARPRHRTLHEAKFAPLETDVSKAVW